MNRSDEHPHATQQYKLHVKIGDKFQMRFALGVAEYEVLRRHRHAGWYECRFARWVTEVPAFRQGFVGSIEVFERARILEAMQRNHDE